MVINIWQTHRQSVLEHVPLTAKYSFVRRRLLQTILGGPRAPPASCPWWVYAAQLGTDTTSNLKVFLQEIFIFFLKKSVCWEIVSLKNQWSQQRRRKVGEVGGSEIDVGVHINAVCLRIHDMCLWCGVVCVRPAPPPLSHSLKKACSFYPGLSEQRARLPLSEMTALLGPAEAAARFGWARPRPRVQRWCW